MPTRYIHESCCASATLARLSFGAECLFWHLVTRADDFGRFDARPTVVRSLCFMLRPIEAVSNGAIVHWLRELVEQRAIHLFQDGQRFVGEFVSWKNYQNRRAKKSRFPLPDSRIQLSADAITCQQMLADADTCPQPPTNVITPRSRSSSNTSLDSEAVQSGSMLLSRDSVESRRDESPVSSALSGDPEQKENSRTHARSKKRAAPDPAQAAQPAHVAQFEAFYAAYPVHLDRKRAESAFARLKPNPELFAKIMADFPERYRGIDRAKIPYPATYINGRRFEDEDMPSQLSLGGAKLSPGMANLKRHWEAETHGQTPGDKNPDAGQRGLAAPANRRPNDRRVG